MTQKWLRTVEVPWNKNSEYKLLYVYVSRIVDLHVYQILLLVMVKILLSKIYMLENWHFSYEIRKMYILCAGYFSWIEHWSPFPTTSKLKFFTCLQVLREMGQAGQVKHGISPALYTSVFCLQDSSPACKGAYRHVSGVYCCHARWETSYAGKRQSFHIWLCFRHSKYAGTHLQWQCAQAYWWVSFDSVSKN